MTFPVHVEEPEAHGGDKHHLISGSSQPRCWRVGWWWGDWPSGAPQVMVGQAQFLRVPAQELAPIGS